MKAFLCALMSVVGLSACTELQSHSFDRAFAEAVVSNDTRTLFSTCNRTNATRPINGVQPIYYAANHGNEDAIDLLYNSGASLTTRSPEGRSLAYAAAVNGHSATAAKLVKIGGGSSSDLAAGRAQWQRNREQKKAHDAMMIAGMAWIANQMFRDSISSDTKSESDKRLEYFQHLQMDRMNGTTSH